MQLAGVRIKNLHDLAYILRSKRAGDAVEVVFLRNGQEHHATTTLDRRH